MIDNDLNSCYTSIKNGHPRPQTNNSENKKWEIQHQKNCLTLLKAVK
jgi:hypothetical protein